MSSKGGLDGRVRGVKAQGAWWLTNLGLLRAGLRYMAVHDGAMMGGYNWVDCETAMKQRFKYNQ